MLDDWMQIDDWQESLAARPYESGHLKPAIQRTGDGPTYAEVAKYWRDNDVTQRSPQDEWRLQHHVAKHTRGKSNGVAMGYALAQHEGYDA